jgi:hypothetical protein
MKDALKLISKLKKQFPKAEDDLANLEDMLMAEEVPEDEEMSMEDAVGMEEEMPEEEMDMEALPEDEEEMESMEVSDEEDVDMLMDMDAEAEAEDLKKKANSPVMAGEEAGKKASFIKRMKARKAIGKL